MVSLKRRCSMAIAFPPPICYCKPGPNRTSIFLSCQIGHRRRVHGCGGTLHSSEGEPGAWEGETGEPTLRTHSMDRPPPLECTLVCRWFVDHPRTLFFLLHFSFPPVGVGACAPLPASTPCSTDCTPLSIGLLFYYTCCLCPVCRPSASWCPDLSYAVVSAVSGEKLFFGF